MPHSRVRRFAAAQAVRSFVGWPLLAVLSYVVELVLFTSGRGRFGAYWSPVMFLGAGLLLCWAAARTLRDQPFAQAAAPRVVQRVGWAGAALLGGGLLVLRKQIPLVLSSPLDLHMSDVIPIVQTYVDRFRSGEVVYRYLTNLPYPLFPNHLPLQWLPYVPVQALGIDFRWASLALLLLLGFGSYQLTVLRQPGNWVSFGLKALLPAYALWLMIKKDEFLFTYVLEFTIICYYFLLAASVLSRSAWAQGVALVLCLLSRYSVVFWVPFYVLLLWQHAGRRHTLVVVGIVAAGITGLYVVPFLAQNPTIFIHALAEYRIATLGEWSRSDGVGGHLFNGLSAASWLYTYLDMPLEAKITWVQRLHVAASGGVMGVLAGLYWRYGRRYDYRYVALLSLKAYLAVFYFFIQIPYAYLISLSVLLSVFVVSLVLGVSPGLTNASRQTQEVAPSELA